MTIFPSILLTALLQTPAPATLDGIVVKLGTAEPVAGVKVELSKAGSLGSSAPAAASADNVNTVTGSDGKFAFKDVAPENYRVVASGDGGDYAATEYGQRTPGGRGLTITLSEGQRMTGARLEMSLTGSVSGRVTDQDGDPVGNARVMALNSVYRDGRRVLNIVEAVKTNDLGEYRLFWLLPGRYYIAVMPQDLRNRTFSVYVPSPGRSATREDATTPAILRRTLETGETIEETWTLVYYGSGSDAASALPIEVRPAAHIDGVDVPLSNAKVRAHRVRGAVFDANGQPAANAAIRIVPRSPAPHMIIPNGTADRNGVFDIPGVVRGSYTLVATNMGGGGGGAGETFFDISRGTVEVISLDVADADVENLKLTLKPPYSVQGRVLDAGSSNGGSDLSAVRVSLVRTPDVIGLPNAGPVFARPGDASNGEPAADGAFTLRGFGPGDYRVNVTGMPAEAYVQSIRLDDVDILNGVFHVTAPPQGQLEISIKRNGASVDGTVTDAKAQPEPNVTVVLVPEPRLRARTYLYKTASTDASGRFQTRGIPSGDYTILAWENVEAGAWEDPDFIKLYEGRGERIHLDDAAKNSVQLKVIP